MYNVYFFTDCVLHLYARLAQRLQCNDLCAEGCGCGFAWTVYAVTDAYLHVDSSTLTIYLPKPFSIFFLPSAFGCLEVRGRIVDIDRSYDL